jgi:CHASE3 domain sensor protein
MHILRQIFLFRMALWATIVVILGFIFTFAVGIWSVSESDKVITHAAAVLTRLSAAQTSVETAVNEARNMLFTGAYDQKRLKSLRDDASYHIDELDAVADGDEEQERNISDLRAAFNYRETLQDEQILTSQKGSGTVNINVGLGQALAKSVYDTERAVSEVRVHELKTLFERDLSRSAVQWRVIYLMITFMAASIGLTVYLFVHLIGELTYRRQIAEKLRQNTHISIDGELQFGQQDINELLNVIEQGERQVEAVKGGI